MPVGGNLNKQETDSREFNVSETIQFSKFDYDKPYQIRFVNYVGPIRRVWIPSITESKETGELMNSWYSLMVPKAEVKTILQQYAIADRAAHIRVYGDSERFSSIFYPQKKYLYLGFLRSDTEPIVRRLEVPKAVHDALIQFRKSESPDRGKLLYGPWWFYDALVTLYLDKSRGEKLPDYQRRKYSVQIYKNKWEGLVNTSINIENSEESLLSVDYAFLEKNNIFTLKEIEALKKFESENNVVDEIRPLSNSEIISLLQEKPINIKATQKGGTPVFSNIPIFIEELKKGQLTYIAEDVKLLSQESSSSGKIENDSVDNELPPPAPTLDKNKEIKSVRKSVF